MKKFKKEESKMEKEIKVEETYQMRIYCSNCGFPIKCTIPKGKTFKQFRNKKEAENTECPNCGCKFTEKAGAENIHTESTK